MAETSGTSVRADVWVWSVRLFRSRSLATAACKGGQVHVNGRRAKPSSPVTIGDRVEATTPGGARVLVVEQVLRTRVSATLAAQAYADHSPPPPPREVRQAMPQRAPGAGRPTKRDRRRMDAFRGRAG